MICKTKGCKRNIEAYSAGYATTTLARHYEKNQSFQQKKIDNYFANTSCPTSPDFNKEKMDELLLRRIFVSMQPFTILEEKPFPDFLSSLNPAYKVILFLPRNLYIYIDLPSL